jgi:hypothetical protein
MQGSDLRAQKRRVIPADGTIGQQPLPAARIVASCAVPHICPLFASGGVPGDQVTTDCSDGRTVRIFARDSANPLSHTHTSFTEWIPFLAFFCLPHMSQLLALVRGSAIVDMQALPYRFGPSINKTC